MHETLSREPLVDGPRLQFARATNMRLGKITKALQIQAVAASHQDDNETDWADCFAGSWAFYAPPAKAAVDGNGNVSGACELVTAGFGDQTVVLGQRDVRWNKLTQDVKAGESVQFNQFGDRVLLAEKAVSITAGGGSLLFDKEKKKVAITGIPATPGGAAPYISMDTQGIGLVSSTGGASMTAKLDQVTLSGAGISLNGGSVNLGTGAYDAVVMNARLAATLVVIQTWLNTHVHTSSAPLTPTSPPVVPIAIPMSNGSFRCKTA